MEFAKSNGKINIELNDEEALVLFDFLSRFNSCEHSSIIEDQAEERILFDLEAILERSLDEVLNENYPDKLFKARNKTRDAI